MLNDQTAQEVADALGMQAVKVADQQWITLKDGFFTGIIFEPARPKESFK